MLFTKTTLYIIQVTTLLLLTHRPHHFDTGDIIREHVNLIIIKIHLIPYSHTPLHHMVIIGEFILHVRILLYYRRAACNRPNTQ